MIYAGSISDGMAAVAAAHHCMTEVYDEPLRGAGASTGRLSDLTFTVKDVVKVRDMRLTAGLGTTLVEADSAENSFVTEMLANGASCLGIAASAELAFDLSGELGFPAPKNPRGADLQTGGSSSGSAVAVSLGFGDFSIVTDTGGSARVPEACCGVIGFKPSRDGLPTDQTVTLSETCDHLGVITRDFEVLDRVLGLKDTAAPAAQAPNVILDQLAIAVPDTYLLRYLSAPAQKWFESLRNKLTAAGVVLRDLDLEFLDQAEPIYSTIVPFEAFRRHKSLLGGPNVHLSAPMRERLGAAGRIGADDYATALDRLQHLRECMAKVSENFPLLLLPTLPDPAPVRGQILTTIGAKRVALRDATLALTAFANLIGAPAVSFPVEVAEHNSPGVQLVGLGVDDGGLLSAARQLMTISVASEHQT